MRMIVRIRRRAVGDRPRYDLPSTHPYGDVTTALTLNGRHREDIGRVDFIALAERLSVPRRALDKTLADVVAGVGDSLDTLSDVPFGLRTIARWRHAIEYGLRRVTQPD
jgi:serine/threonine-protein kinase HipA